MGSSLAGLSSEQQSTVRQCLVAVVEGPFFDESDFHTHIGIDKEEAIVLMALNEMPDSESALLLVNNSLNEVANGINFSPREWARWFTVTREQVRAVYSLWYSLAIVSGSLM